jgi:hypothetical protein
VGHTQEVRVGIIYPLLTQYCHLPTLKTCSFILISLPILTSTLIPYASIDFIILGLAIFF